MEGSGPPESCRVGKETICLQSRKGEPRQQSWAQREDTPPLPRPLLHTSSSLQGFEPRDTEISRKLEVWKAMQALTGPKNLLSLSPDPEINR